MKKFLVVMLMLMMLCVVGCDGKKAEGAGAFTGDVVIMGETLGKSISDKSTYTLEEVVAEAIEPSNAELPTTVEELS